LRGDQDVNLLEKPLEAFLELPEESVVVQLGTQHFKLKKDFSRCA